jgi:DNA-binding MarR family transcriptional regulator
MTAAAGWPGRRVRRALRLEVLGMSAFNSSARSAAASETDGVPERTRSNGDPIDYGPLAQWIGFYLRLAQTASFQVFAHETEQVDLRPGRFAILMLIGRNPGISQTALSRANARDKSTLTPALTDLAKRGLITRTRLKTDRRSYQLKLTAAGEDMLQRLTECAVRHDRNLDRIVGKQDRERFLQILQKLVTELSRD